MTINGIGEVLVGHELRAMKSQGIAFQLHALRAPENSFFDADDIARFEAETQYLYPLGTARALAALIAAPGRFGVRFWAALWNALTGERESLSIRARGLWHLAVACHWAAELRASEVSHVHSQWIHAGGTVAMYGAWLMGVSFSFTGHAADLFRERAALTDKIKRADFIACISEFHRQFYLDNGARPEKLHVVHCGIDSMRFIPNRRDRPDGVAYHILSAGRLVEKKGFAVLINACEILKSRGLHFHCTIGGSGPLEATLREEISQRALVDEVTLTGQPIKHEDLPAFMGEGDVFALACVWAKDNDVDGLPVMLMEAMACGLPAVSTQLVGIPDLIRDGETGLLVPTEDPVALADALERLSKDRAVSERLADAGTAHVREAFDLPSCLHPLLTQFRARLQASSEPSDAE